MERLVDEMAASAGWIFMLLATGGDGNLAATSTDSVLKIEIVTEAQCKTLHDVVHASSAVGAGRRFMAMCISPDGKMILEFPEEK